MNPALIKDLTQETPGPWHDKLLQHIRSLVDMSRANMSQYYDMWDKTYKAFTNHRDLDKEDIKNISKGRPYKIQVPQTYAQVSTFVSFMFMLYHQRERFFELESAGGAEDDKLKETVEKLLAADLTWNQFSLKLYQYILDVARFGIGIFKVSWETVKDTFLTQTNADEFRGLKTGISTMFQEVTTYEGNKIINVSPYNFFPDTRLPLTRFQEGEFCASEQEFPMHKLKSLQADGFLAGVDHVTKFQLDQRNKRDGVSRFSTIDFNNEKTLTDNICITEVQVRIVPDQYELSDGTRLGNTSKPVSFIIWMANDNRIIRVQPLNYYHGQFTYTLGQFSPDEHKKVSYSLTDQIKDLQELTNWFYNSRVEAVHRTLDNQLVVDPSVVDMSTVTNGSRVITMKRGAPKVGIERFIKPLPVVDATTGHITDVQMLSDMIERVTGLNQTAQGQFHSGRRSATEARGAISGAASRLTLCGKLMWDAGIAPLGKQMMINSRQSISQETYQVLIGDNPEQLAMFEAYKADVFTLTRKADYFVFDGTLASEKHYTAQALQELLSIVASSPEFSAMLNIDLKALVLEIYRLRGVRNLHRFEAPPEQNMLMQLMQQVQGGQIQTQ